MEIKKYMELALDYFRGNGFTQNQSPEEKSLNGNAYFYTSKHGKSMMGLMPYADHFFVHELDGDMANKKELVLKIHENERAFVNASIKTPKAFRMKVPNIVSVFFTDNIYDSELISYVKENTSTFKGGEAHSIFLIDTINKTVVSQGIKETYVMGTAGTMHIKLNKTDPINRAYYLVHDMCNKIFN